MNIVLALLFGCFAAISGYGLWWLGQFGLVSVHQFLEGRLFIVPLCLAGFVVLIMRMRRHTWHASAFPEMVEEYYFGIQRTPALLWFVRFVTSFVAAVFLGVFGIEGAILELQTGLLQAAMARFPRRFYRLTQNQVAFRQLLVAASLAGAFTVIFGAPLAGSLFVLEILMISAIRIWPAVFLSALTAAMTLWGLSQWGPMILPTEVLFDQLLSMKPVALGHGQFLLLALVTFIAGAAVGLGSSAFARAEGWLDGAFEKIHFHRWQIVLACGVAMSTVLYLTPDAHQIFWLRLSLGSALVIFLTRAVVLLFAIKGFGSSGIFTPLFFLAALTGYIVGALFNVTWAFPVALASCAALLFAGFSAPLTALALLLERGGHDGFLLSLAAVATLGAWLAQRLLRWQPYLTQILERCDIRLVHGRCANVLAHLQMQDAMVTDVSTVSDNANLTDLQQVSASSKYNIVGVISSDGVFRGLITINQLPHNMDLKGVRTSDLIDRRSTLVRPHTSLDRAFELLVTTQALAVVDEEKKFLGLILETGLMTRYYREMARRAFGFHTVRRN